MILALFDRLGVTEAESFDHIHSLVEATKRAIRVRDRAVTDPAFLAHPLDRYLEPRFIAGEAMKIDRRKAARWPLAPGEGDTIWMGAADASGLVVSYIQSLYWEFGSGCVLPATGVLMQNRGASFSLQSGALNPLMPGRLPFHTLNPALAVLKDGRIMAYGCMGGDGQPQTQSALFTRHVTFREPLADAIDRPRWVLGRTWGAARTALRLEPRFDGNLIDALANAGHEVEVLDEPYSDVMGHAGAVVLHKDGSLRRRARSARGWRGGGGRRRTQPHAALARSVGILLDILFALGVPRIVMRPACAPKLRRRRRTTCRAEPQPPETPACARAKCRRDAGGKCREAARSRPWSAPSPESRPPAAKRRDESGSDSDCAWRHEP